MKILFLPKYSSNGASSRYRTYQYLQFFKDYDFSVEPLFDESYIESLYNKKSIGSIYILKRYLKRIFKLCQFYKYDIIFLEKEFFPYIPFCNLMFKVLNVSYIVDYDDAIFHNYLDHKSRVVKYLLKNKISSVIKKAKYVITGSPYLTEYALKYNKNVIEIPTSIDIEKYELLEKKTDSDKFIIGWIGSPTTSIHLEQIIEALKVLKNKKVNFELRLVGYSNTGIDFENLPVKIIDWSKENEIIELNKFDVGIMPMIALPFVKGKCAFKLIQYMAVAKPTISSTFEANIKVDRNNDNFFADTTQEWVVAFEQLISEKNISKEIGERNRIVIQNEYSIQANKDKILHVIKNVFNAPPLS